MRLVVVTVVLLMVLLACADTTSSALTEREGPHGIPDGVPRGSGAVVLATRSVSAGHVPPRIEAALRTAAVTWRVSYWTLRRKAWCESRYYAKARNRSSGAAGLFQFLRGTWRSTPYRSLSVYDPYANALAAAWMHRVGRGGEWVCQ